MSTIDLAVCISLAAICGYAIYRRNRNEPLSVDEGYLWYGALRTREGLLPLRDFRSYEPGRYWWVAAFMAFAGPGLGSVRAAALLFYVGGVAAALAGLRLCGMELPALGLVTVLLFAWAYPVYKLFEPALLLFGFFAAVLMILHPGAISAVLAGGIFGIAAVFGLNYGLYLGLALGYIGLAALTKASGIDAVDFVVAGLAGVALGSAPLWLTALCSPAFSRTLYRRRVRAVVARGTSNLPLPIPWPWRPLPRLWRGYPRAARELGRGLFVAMPVLGLGAVVWILVSPWPVIAANAGWLAAGAILSCALHHPLSRADYIHLCQTMPLLVVCVAALCGPGWLGVLGPAVLLGWGAGALIPGMPWAALRAPPGPVPPLGKRLERLIAALRDLQARHLQAGESLLALPLLVAVYPLMGLRSPVYDTFCVYPAGDEDQDRMLQEIEASGVRLAVILDTDLDGREDLRFSQTHPRIWAHLNTHFDRLPGVPQLADHHFFLRRTTQVNTP